MIFDVNISWGAWPFQDFKFISAIKMKKFLRGNGIGGGLIRSAEAVFSPDLEYCNKRLTANFKDNDNFIPIPTVSPYSPEWEKLLESDNCPPAFAVYPSYHDYSVLSEEFANLASALEAKNKALMIIVRQEDERGQNKFCQVPAVPVTEINQLGRKFTDLKIICLNCYFGELTLLLADAPNVSTDIAFTETLNTVKSILRNIRHEQIVFGSHTPFLYTKSALMKLEDSGVDKKIIQAIGINNIKRILK